MLSRSRRKKQRREAEQDGQGEKAPEGDLSPPLLLSSRLMLWTMCTLVCFVSASLMVSQLINLKARCKIWLSICFRSYDRGIMDQAAGRAFVQSFSPQG